MAKTLEQWVTDIENRNLPVMAQTIVELKKLNNNIDEISAHQIAEVVLRDLFLSIRVLRDANDKLHNKHETDITTIEHGVMMIGIREFFSKYLKLPILENELNKRPEVLEGLRRSLYCTYHGISQAYEIAVLRHDNRVDEIPTAALLTSMGQPLLWYTAPEHMTEMEEVWKSGSMPYEQAQTEILGCLLSDIQNQLAIKWKLPEALRAFTDPQNMMKPRVIALDLSLAIARHAEKGWYRADLQSMYALVSAVLHNSVDAVVHVVHRTAIRVAKDYVWFKSPPAATWLPMLDGKWPEEEEREEKNLKAHPERYQEAINEIKRHLDNTLTLGQMVDIALKGMREGIGLNRAIFAMMTADRSRVKTKYVISTGTQSMLELRRFAFDMDEKNLFAKIMTKPQSVWYNESNRDKFQPLLPLELQELVGHDNFFAMSIHVKNRPVALIYADKRNGAGPLTEVNYEHFKKLCLHLSNGLLYLAHHH